LRPFCRADLSTEVDHAQREVRPGCRRKKPHQVALDLHRIGVQRQPPPAADTPDVRVHNHAGLPERTADDDVGGLPADAVELQQFLHGLRHDTAEFLNERARHAYDRACLLPVESRGADVALEFGRAGRREVGGGPVLRKERRRHPVDLRVGALGRQNGRNQ
jgi:hypothetical protein